MVCATRHLVPQKPQSALQHVTHGLIRINNTMKNFNQDRGGRFSGGFGKRSDTTMHKATCSSCGKSCEVPFRPVNGKPVYCKDCFDQMGGASGGDRNDRPARSEFRSDFKKDYKKFEPRNNFRSDAPRFEPKREGGNDELKRQLELVNTKLDKLIIVAENFFQMKSSPKIGFEMPAAGEAEPAKKEAKKASKKTPKSE
jgi:CxxC-x17-CxxC domain-containing protein